MDQMIWIGGAAVGAVVAFLVGYLVRARAGRNNLQSAERRAQSLLDQAQGEAEASRRNALLEGREEALRLKQQVERETQEARTTLLAAERAFHEKEAAFSRRVELIDKKERDLKRSETELRDRESAVQARDGQLDKLIAEQTGMLERVARMSAEEARARLMAEVENEAKAEAARHVTEIRETAQRNAEREARKIIGLAIQRYSADHVSEVSVSVVHLPSDDMKGRIIGREGRNIRSFEVITGVDVIIDDTPDTVVISCFDPIRREVARRSLEALIVDGRIHPGRIEEVVAKIRRELDQQLVEAGEQAAYDANVHGIHPELIKLIGRMKYRTSYGQNILEHSKEVAWIAGNMAAELHVDPELARRGGLLHDIGKVLTHESEGTHVELGVEMARKYGESAAVINCIHAHHDDVPHESTESVLVQAADAISGARPGARREAFESYVKRLTRLEEIANAFKGVEKCNVIQAGREVRVVVTPDQIDDAGASALSEQIAKRIEDELQYPGQIRVVVIRETRAVGVAR